MRISNKKNENLEALPESVRKGIQESESRIQNKVFAFGSMEKY
jgi:hypothetical protein